MRVVYREDIETAIQSNGSVCDHYVADNPGDLVPQGFMAVLSFPKRISFDYDGKPWSATNVEDIVALLEKDGIRVVSKNSRDKQGEER